MKKTGAFIAGLFLSLAGMAQENKGGISDFMKEEIADFDKFMVQIKNSSISCVIPGKSLSQRSLW